MGIYKSLFKQTAIYGLATVLPRMFSFILVPLYTNPAVLNVQEYGEVSVIFSWMVLFNVILAYGMETAFFHFSNKIEEKERVYSTALISIFGSSIGLSLLFILFSGSIADFIKEPEHVNYIIWCVLILATDAMMAIPFARLRLNNQAKKFGALKLLNVFVFILICIFYFKSQV